MTRTTNTYSKYRDNFQMGQELGQSFADMEFKDVLVTLSLMAIFFVILVKITRWYLKINQQA